MTTKILLYFYLVPLLVCFVATGCRNEEPVSVAVLGSFSPEDAVKELKSIGGLSFEKRSGGSSRVGQELGNLGSEKWHFLANRSKPLSLKEMETLMNEIHTLLIQEIKAFGVDVHGRGSFVYLLAHSRISYSTANRRGSLSIIISNYDGGVSLHIDLLEEPAS